MPFLGKVSAKALFDHLSSLIGLVWKLRGTHACQGGGCDRGRGRGRGRRGRRGHDGEEESGMTLDEYEAMQRRPKPTALPAAHPSGTVYPFQMILMCSHSQNHLVHYLLGNSNLIVVAMPLQYSSRPVCWCRRNCRGEERARVLQWDLLLLHTCC